MVGIAIQLRIVELLYNPAAAALALALSFVSCGGGGESIFDIIDNKGGNGPAATGDWAVVAGGHNYSLTLKTDGSLWACGYPIVLGFGMYYGGDSSVLTRVGGTR